MGRIMNGSQTYEKTIHMAVFVNASWASGRPRPFRAQLRGPLDERIVVHA